MAINYEEVMEILGETKKEDQNQSSSVESLSIRNLALDAL